MKYLVFTDLDGSLLNHDDYDYQPAIPAIEELRSASIPIIFTSSKTKVELLHYAEMLAIHHPFIFETGCGVYWPAGYFHHLDTTQKSFCTARQPILELLDKLRGDGYHFTGFNDMSAAELAADAGLAEESASHAKDRYFSEPIIWQDDTSKLAGFEAEVNSAGLRLVRGGRYIHVMGESDKAKSMRWIVAQYQQESDGESIRTIGLGDSLNDREMLNIVDHAYLVRNLHLQDEQIELMKISGIKQTIQCGAKGWHEAIMDLLRQI